MSGLIIILWLVGIFVLPFVLGSLLARALRMKEDSRRFAAIFMVLILALAPFIHQVVNGHRLRDAFRLGIDLAGGTNLVYQADKEQAESSGKEINTESMSELTRAIARRVNPTGTEEVTVRPVGTDRVEIIIPGADTDYVQAMKDKITRLGSLEFAILAARHDSEHRGLIARAEQPGVDEVYDGKVLRAKWLPVANIQSGPNAGQAKDVEGDPNQDVFRDREVNGQTIREFLVILEPAEQKVDGRYLVNARPTMDQNGGVAVGFTFNSQGGFLFQNLTGRYQPKKDGNKYRLAAVLDGKIHSAPNINEMIGESGQISGNFTNEEVTELVSVLNAGALEIPLVKEPVSEYTISPLLGVDVQEKGMLAIGISAAAVVIFMIVYYWVGGIIADICLIFNLLMVLGAMALIDATFTLPGLAGLVLTIGMAVDANVLIFERMREELAKGSSLRMTIHNGFDKAFSSILDANLTTLISAVILYTVGTDQIKGFAATLFIGIVTSMFSSLYLGRTMFNVLERTRMISASTLLGRSFVGKTNFDFLKYKWVCTIFSIGFIVLGLVAMASRGSDNLDIDFTGGSMVTFQFQDDPDIEEARDALETEFGSDMSLERLIVPQPEGSGEPEIFFRLRTKNQNIEQVQTQVNEAFENSSHQLKKVTMEFGEIAAIPEAPAPAEGEEPAPASQFAGGLQTKLTFSDELTIPSVADRFVKTYAKLTEMPAEAVADSLNLFNVNGLEGSGVEVGDASVRRYSAVELQVGSEVSREQFQQILTTIQDQMQHSPVLNEVNTFSSAVAGETQQTAIFAMLASLLAIVAYIWFRFDHLSFGIAAVAALVHDLLFVLGFVVLTSMISATAFGVSMGLTDYKINLQMIAAFMTIIGYSLNDTIVIFDRIREVRGKNPNLTKEIINQSVNSTLSRTILTSFTTLLVVVILFTLGGEGLGGFSYSLIIGIIIGTYSTIFIANPVLLYFANRHVKTN